MNAQRNMRRLVTLISVVLMLSMAQVAQGATFHFCDILEAIVRQFDTTESFADWLGPTNICGNLEDVANPDCESCRTNLGLRGFSGAQFSHGGVGVVRQTCSVNGSVIDNFTFNHIHDAIDYSPGGGSGSGCCGGGSPAGNLPSLTIQRFHRSRNMTESSSFGPGVFSNWDIRLSLFAVGNTHRVQLFDPSDLYGRELIDGQNSTAKDGVFQDIDTEVIGELRLYDNADQLVTGSLSSAVRAEIENKQGEVLHFDIFDQASTVPAWLNDSERGNVVQLGGNNYFNVTGYKGITGSAARTSSAWIRTTSTGSVMYWGTNQGGKRWGMRVQTENGTPGAIRVEVHGGYIVGSTDLRDGQWHHVAATLPVGATNVNQVKLYVDGQLETTSASLGKAINTTANGDVKLGDDLLDRRFEGDLDDVRIYSRALTATEIANLAADTPGSLDTDAALQGYWKMDEASGATATDSSSNGRDATSGNVDPELVGRLTKTRDRNDYGVTLTYKKTTGDATATYGEKWQIDTITDAYNRTVTFTYEPQQVSGQWAVDKITLPNGEEIDYTYSGGMLTQVDHADGTQSTFSYGVDNGLAFITFSDAAADGTHRNKTAYYTSNIFVQAAEDDDGYQMFNQAAMQVRAIVNPDGEVLYANVSGEAFEAPNFRRVYLGAGKMAEMRGFVSTRFYENFSIDGTNGYDSISGTYESQFASISDTDVNTTKDQMELGIPAEYRDAQGRLYQMEYDSENFPTKKTYSDGSVERWSYGPFHLVTRSEDRLGRVTEMEYDARGNLRFRREGIVNTAVYQQASPDRSDAAINDVNQAEFAEYEWQYFASGHQNQFLLQFSFDANDNRTEYIYNADQLLVEVKEPDDDGTGFHIKALYTYEDNGASAQRLKTSTDAVGRTSTMFYDARDRAIMVQYADSSTERTAYGAPGSGDENLVVASQDRNGNVTSMEYDAQGRLTKRIQASHRIPLADVVDASKTDLNVLLAGNEITDPNVRVEYTCSYLDGTNLRRECVNAGEKTSYAYDYRHRSVGSTRHVRDGKALTSKTVYVDNLPFSSEDPYGRKSFSAYRASDSSMIRSVTATIPNPTGEPTTFTQVLNLTRAGTPSTPAPNAEYLISDSELDVAGQQFATIDPRGVVHASEYDSRGRAVKNVEAATVLASYTRADYEYGINEGSLAAIAAKSETVYDPNSNVVEQRSPRYFDANDAEGFNQANTTSSYTRRNLPFETTDAAGAPAYIEGDATAVRVTQSFTYFLDGTRDTVTDFRGNAWGTLWQTCCRRVAAQFEPLADVDDTGTQKHAVRITNYDHYGNVTHSAIVKAATIPAPAAGDCCGGSSFYNDPPDADTLNEVTTRYDARNRPIATTKWLVPRGNIDPNNVPIAGLDGVPAADGLTTRMFYDEDLTDGTGLESGIAVLKLQGGGNFTLDISQLLTELSLDGTDPDAASADFQATASVNAEDEISVSISDGGGRTVASGIIEQDGTPITWSTIQLDAVVTVVGFGDCLETVAIDALNHVKRNRDDGVNRTIETEDAEGEMSTVTYDASGNTLSARDSNGVGTDCKYDERNRVFECTDTEGDTVKQEFSKNNLVVKTIDAKLNEITCRFDARNRKFERTDRVNAVTKWRFDQNNNLLSLEDGENQLTAYEYDVRNLQVKTTWPDHVIGQNPGDQDYGITETTYDAAHRTLRETDQQGDTQTNIWDMVNRLEQKDYRLRINSPVGLISDSNIYDYDDVSRPVQGVSGRYSNTCDLAYDNAGRTTSESLTVLAQTYTVGSVYDEANRRTGLTYPDGTIVNREYTDRNQLEFVKYTNTAVGGALNAMQVDGRVYDPGMRLQTINHGNGITTTKAYRDDNLTQSITRAGLTGADFVYTYDANKNKTSETISGVMQPFGFSSTSYDDEDRLTGWNRADGNKSQTYGLTPVGDWFNFTESGTTPFTETRTHGATHELTNIIGGGNAGPISYDPKGNITTNSNGQGYTWDFDNQLSTVVVPVGALGTAGTHNYTYDAFGRRVSKAVGGTSPQTLVFVCAGQQVIAEYIGGTAPATAERKFIYASYIDEPIVFIDRTALGSSAAGVEELFYYHCNNLYSVTALTDSTGTVQERYAYDAYGSILFLNAAGTPLGTQASTVGQSYTFTGRRLDDESALYYYRARYYDAVLGRFVERDPIGYRSGYNLYAYVSARTLIATDPFGLEEVIVLPLPAEDDGIDGPFLPGDIILKSDGRGAFFVEVLPDSGPKNQKAEITIPVCNCQMTVSFSVYDKVGADKWKPNAMPAQVKTLGHSPGKGAMPTCAFDLKGSSVVMIDYSTDDKFAKIFSTQTKKLKADISLKCFADACNDCGCASVGVNIASLDFWYSGLKEYTYGRLNRPKPASVSVSNCEDKDKRTIACKETVNLNMTQGIILTYGATIKGSVDVTIFSGEEKP